MFSAAPLLLGGFSVTGFMPRQEATAEALEVRESVREISLENYCWLGISVARMNEK